MKELWVAAGTKATAEMEGRGWEGCMFLDCGHDPS